MAKRNKPGFCAYCGEWSDPVTDEHVFPTAIFSPKQPKSQRIIIPACGPCNNEKAKSDGEFRDSLIMSPDAWKHPDALRLIVGEFKRATISNRSRVARSLDEATIGPWINQDGFLLPNQLTAEIDPFPIGDVVSHISAGLIFHVTNKIVSQSHSFFVKDLAKSKFELCWREFETDDSLPHGIEGNGVAQWGLTFSDDYQDSVPAVNCIMQFYGARSFFILVAPKLLIPESPPTGEVVHA